MYFHGYGYLFLLWRLVAGVTFVKVILYGSGKMGFSPLCEHNLQKKLNFCQWTEYFSPQSNLFANPDLWKLEQKKISWIVKCWLEVEKRHASAAGVKILLVKCRISKTMCVVGPQWFTISQIHNKNHKNTTEGLQQDILGTFFSQCLQHLGFASFFYVDLKIFS